MTTCEYTFCFSESCTTSSGRTIHGAVGFACDAEGVHAAIRKNRIGAGVVYAKAMISRGHQVTC